MFDLTAAILVVTTGVIPNTSWGASWSEINNGLPGISLGVNLLVVDHMSPSTIYAQAIGILGNSPVATPALFKTTDGGVSWRVVSSVFGVTCLAIDPENSSIIYAGTNQGVVKSTNGGESWIGAGSGLPSGAVNRLAIDPISPSTLYAVSIGPVGNPFSNPGSPANAIFKSTNGGGSWNALNTGLSPNAFVNILVIDPATPSTIYLSAPPFGPPAADGGPPMGGVLRSTDAGESWSALTGLPPNAPINSLAVDPGASSIIYVAVPSLPPPPGGGASSSGGILKSTDGGKSWTALPGVPANTTVTNLVIDPTAPSTIYAAGSSFTSGPPSFSILKSTDGGQHWNAYNIGLPTNTSINALALDPITPSNIYAGFVGFFVNGVSGPAGGVFKSADGGQSWNAAAAGLASFDVRTLAVNPVDANTLYAGGLGGVFTSADGGANWNSAGLSAYTGSLLADSVNPNILYAQTGTSNGCDSSQNLLLRSADSGASWNVVSPLNSGCILNVTFPSAHNAPMAIDPVNSNTLYIAESDDLDGYSALLKSTGGGANWIAIWDWFGGLRGSVKALAIDPSHTTTLYAGVDDPSAESSGLFKSIDGGATWSNTGFAANSVNLLAIDPSNSLIIYAGATSDATGLQGVFKSADGGASWLAINKGLDGLIGTGLTTATALVVDRTNTSILYLGTSNGGVFRSIDGGANWSALNDGLANLQIRALVVAPKPTRTVYAATAGGVFKIVDE